MSNKFLILFLTRNNSNNAFKQSVKSFHSRSIQESMALATSSSRFVPKHEPINEDDVLRLNEFISNSKNLFVLSGAGISTESGIPDYRSEGVGLYASSKHRPMLYSEFLSSSNRRKIYWARNYVSWPLFSSFKPNLSHYILSDWEKRNKAYYHVTQNVDSLLVKAGCLKLTELHGTSYKVSCLDCDFRLTREAMQVLIKSQNPQWTIMPQVLLNDISPDNDVRLTDEQIQDFNTPKCPRCNNDRLKPEVVFFGDNIPKDRVNLVKEKLENCDSLLALGTSLQVYSAFRIILQAKEQKIPIAIVSIGNTRGDNYANLKINTKCSEILKKISF